MLNDQQLGQRLVQSGKVTEAALQAALSEQKRLIMEGRNSRLGELLVSRGLCSAADVQEALAGQGKKIGECDACGARFNVVAWSPNRLYRCGKCQGVLRPVEVAEDVAVSGTKVMPAVGAPPPETKRKQKLGNITLMRELGRGGMGVVYQGLQEELRRTVAVKVLIQSDDAKLKARFLREARVVSKLRHPNIVGVYELGEAAGKAYFTMDYIEGGPLNALFAPNPLPVKELLGYVKTIALALDYAHKQGLVHRDIKPQNILVSSAGVPFLTDFGLAREVESSTRLTMSGAVMGTPAYMSPEQARGEGARVDRRSDLYSLGAVLYEGLTGRPPVDGQDLIAMLESIVKVDPKPPSELAPGTPRDVETICLKALSKSADKRYQTGEEFAADIDRFLTGGAIEARRSGAVENAVKWGKRRPALVLSAGVGLAVALVAGIVIWRGHVNAEAERTRHEREAEIAKLERERYEQKLRDLEERLSQAGTEDERERIRKEIEAAKGVTPDPGIAAVKQPPVENPPLAEAAWKAADLEVRGLLKSFLAGEALAKVGAFAPKSKEDEDWKSRTSSEIRESIDKNLEGARASARESESAGRFDDAVNSWTWVKGWGVAACTEEADAEIARIRGVADAAVRAAWKKDRLPALLKAVGNALKDGAYDAARAAIAAEEKGGDPQEIVNAKWIVARAEQFQEAFFGGAGGKDVETFTYGDGVRVVEASKDRKFLSVVLHQQGSEISTKIASNDVLPASMIAVVRKSGGDEDGVALFWWFYAPPAKKDAAGAYEASKNQKRAMDIVAKSQSAARLTAFFDGYREALAGGAPPVEVPPDNPPASGTSAFAVEARPADRFGRAWKYDFSTAEQAGDWMAAPRGPGEGVPGWGAHVDPKTDAAASRFWLRDAQAGWTGAKGHMLKIRAQGTLLDGVPGRFGVMLGGYQAWIANGQFEGGETDAGKSMGYGFDIKKPALNRAIVIEVWIEEMNPASNIHVLVDGAECQVITIAGPGNGPTGVFADGGAVVAWDWIEVSGVVDADVTDHLSLFRAFIAAARAAAGASKTWTDGRSMGPFQSAGEGRWAPATGAIRGKSAGTGPRQEALLRTAGPRNFHLRFKYSAGSAASLTFEARGGAGATILRFPLPLEKTGAWRDCDFVAAERCAWLTVDGLPVFLARPPDDVGAGEISWVLVGGEAAIDEVTFQESTLESGSGPGWPWPPMGGPGPDHPPGPPPGPGGEGWSDLFDRKSLDNFVKTDKTLVKGGELIVGAEMVTAMSWPSVELEVEFATEQPVKFQVGLKGEWVCKADAGHGRHKLTLKATRNGVEAQLDGAALKTSGGAGDKDGPLRIKVDGGPLKVLSVRHRPPGR